MPYNSVPERWEAYTDCGDIIPGTNFIAFKVPLKESLCEKLDDQSLKFTIEDLLKHFSDNHLKVGVIIDLTNTTRYYNPEEFQCEGFQYVKLSTPGHNVLPSEDVFQKFKKQVEYYRDRNLLVGVHCTHGVNRTGYLICRYMIEELHCKPMDAIEKFKVGRGHEMEKYTTDLMPLCPKTVSPRETGNRGVARSENSHQPRAGHSKKQFRHQNNESDHRHFRVQPSIKKHHGGKQRLPNMGHNPNYRNYISDQYNQLYSDSPCHMNYSRHHHNNSYLPRPQYYPDDRSYYHHNRDYIPDQYNQSSGRYPPSSSYSAQQSHSNAKSSNYNRSRTAYK